MQTFIMAAASALLCSALGRIGWSETAAKALVAKGFVTMDDIGAIPKDFLEATCKKLRSGLDKQLHLHPMVTTLYL